MQEKICGFCGHRLVTHDISEQVRDIIINLIENEGINTFYSGSMGEFDNLCEKTIRDLKKIYNNIKLCRIMPYHMLSVNNNPEYYYRLFDEIIVPDFENTHYKKAITMRNRWIADCSDFLICYTRYESGGAYNTRRYAEKTNTHVIDIK